MSDQPGDAVIDSWRRQSWPMRILRGFLGGTFVFAGLQKLADPGFLHSGTPDYIGEQLRAFAHGSPVGPVLMVASHLAILTGVAVALVELAAGAGTLAGVAPKASASVGLAVNLVLFLSATWHVKPYFLGSDSIYAVAWLSYLVGLVEGERRRRRALSGRGSRHRRAAMSSGGGALTRRQFLRGTLVATGTLFVGATAFAVEGSERVVPDPAPTASISTLPSRSRTGHHSASTPTAVDGTPIARLDSLPVGGSLDFQSSSGEPAILIRLARDRVCAFSRVCTHAGCLVDYDAAASLLVCPCHGAEFDPSQGAAPVAGPAPTALPRIPVAIDRASGDVVATN